MDEEKSYNNLIKNIFDTVEAVLKDVLASGPQLQIIQPWKLKRFENKAKLAPAWPFVCVATFYLAAKQIPFPNDRFSHPFVWHW